MQARVLPAARGAFWIVAGVQLYRRNPPLLSMLASANLLLALVFSQLQPIGPFLLLLLSPFGMALIANACATIARRNPLQWAPADLLDGLRDHAHLLLRLGMLQLVYATVVAALLDLVLPPLDPGALAVPADTQSGQAAAVAARLTAEQATVLLTHLGAILITVLPAFWFAPLLTAWHDVPPLKSVFFSLVAVWRNWRAFLAYGAASAVIVVFIPSLIAGALSLLSASLGEVVSVALRVVLLLVFVPVLMTGTFVGFQDVFTESASEATL